MTKTKPSWKHEQKLWAEGHRHIAGVDEAGKGAWAGPLVAAAVILPANFTLAGVNDSKVLTPKQREHLFVGITRQAVSWSVSLVPPKYIDQYGITQANKKVLLDAVKKLHVKPHAILVDAVKVKYGKKPVQAIINGDAIVMSIAAASIIAKVARDTLMTGEHRLHPLYEFHIHKGYGTPRHQALLTQHGHSPIHRMSFRPMSGRSKKILNRKTKK